MLLKPSVMSKPERKITEGVKIQFKVLLNFAPNWAGRTHWHQLCTGPVKTFEARFVHVARGPTFADFSHLAFVRRPGVATTPCVSPRRGVVRTHPHRQGIIALIRAIAIDAGHRPQLQNKNLIMTLSMRQIATGRAALQTKRGEGVVFIHLDMCFERSTKVLLRS